MFQLFGQRERRTAENLRLKKLGAIKIVRARVGISGSFTEIFFRDQDVLPDTRDRAASYPRARLSPSSIGRDLRRVTRIQLLFIRVGDRAQRGKRKRCQPAGRGKFPIRSVLGCRHRHLRGNSHRCFPRGKLRPRAFAFRRISRRGVRIMYDRNNSAKLGALRHRAAIQCHAGSRGGGKPRRNRRRRVRKYRSLRTRLFRASAHLRQRPPRKDHLGDPMRMRSVATSREHREREREVVLIRFNRAPKSRARRLTFRTQRDGNVLSAVSRFDVTAAEAGHSRMDRDGSASRARFRPTGSARESRDAFSALPSALRRDRGMNRRLPARNSSMRDLGRSRSPSADKRRARFPRFPGSQHPRGVLARRYRDSVESLMRVASRGALSYRRYRPPKSGALCWKRSARECRRVALWKWPLRLIDATHGAFFTARQIHRVV